MLAVVVVVASAALVASPPADGETTVRERRPADVDDARLDDGGAALDADALLAVPGVALVHEGGPLSPVRPLLRGLSGARLDVSALGLPFVDPAAGDVDAALWPWMLGSVDVDVGAGSRGGVGGGLVFRRPAPGLAFSLLTGSLSTLSLSSRAVGAVGDGGGGGAGSGAPSLVGAAVSGGFTRGDFVFRPVDAGGAAGNAFDLAVRENNDQRRFSGAAFADVAVSDEVRVRAAGVFAAHEGGIAGFATAPLPTLRGRRALGSAGAGLTWKGPLTVDVDGSVTGSLRATTSGGFDDDSADALTGTRNAAGVKVKSDLLDGDGWGVDVGVAAFAAGSEIPGRARRQEAGAVVSAVARGAAGALFSAPLYFLVDADLGGRVVDDVGAFLPTGSLRLGLLREGVTTFIGVARAARAPTLDERFAPRGFVEGNPFLRPEATNDVEAGVVLDTGDVRVRAVGFASRLDEAIVVVNRSAFSVVPVNTGPAHRAGVDLGAAFSPAEHLAFDVTASLLTSEMTVTHAPLPQAPPFSLRSAAHVGDLENVGGAALDVVVTGRGAAPSTLFGTLVSPGYVLVDLVGRLPLARFDDGAVFVVGRVDNALDVKDARDSNLLPLPGRLFFLSLEVRT